MSIILAVVALFSLAYLLAEFTMMIVEFLSRNKRK